MSNSSEQLEGHPIINWVVGNPFRAYPHLETDPDINPTKAANDFIHNLEEEAINDIFNSVKNFWAGILTSPIPIVGHAFTAIAWASALAHFGRATVETAQVLHMSIQKSRRQT